MTEERTPTTNHNRAIALARIANSAPALATVNAPPPLPTQSSSQQQQQPQKQQQSQGTKRKGGLNLDYCEFNLETMHDTRGGFLLSDQPDDLSQLANSDLRQPLRSSDPLPNDAMCVECESVDVCADLFKHYGVVVCRKCRDEFKDKYSLLTKTECREDYLLTESELRDTEKLPYWVKKNPHKDSYANMLLYLRMHVEAFAIAKWGSLEKLDQEFAKREEEKSVRKKKKFENKLVELRKKTLTSTWRRPEKDHVHEFGEKVDKGDCVFEQTCQTCGIVTSFEEM